MASSDGLYEGYHENWSFKDFGMHTFQGFRAMKAYSDVRSVLDFGCGNGHAARLMRSSGFEWYGVEFSRTAYDNYLNEPFFHHGDTTQFSDRQFDLIYSTEVFEHIPEEDVDAVVADLCRVAAKYLFLTISLRPSSDNNRYHCTLQSRAWWEARFTRCGFNVDSAVIDLYQPLTLKSTRKVMSQWSKFGPTAAQFCENPPYDLNGEKEFWYFAFRREGVPAPPLPSPEQPWLRRKVVPLIRRALRMNSDA